MSELITINIFQCQEKAKKIGYNSAEFVAYFPNQVVLCKWIDAYFGFIGVCIEGLEGKIITVRQFDNAFPNVQVSPPFISEKD